jgi:hypothetical protein
MSADYDLEDFVHSRFDDLKDFANDFLVLFESALMDVLPRSPIMSNYSSMHGYLIAMKQYQFESGWFRTFVVTITDLVIKYGQMARKYIEQLYLILVMSFQSVMNLMSKVNDTIRQIPILLELIK